MVISGSQDKTIRLWDLKTRTAIRTFGGWFNKDNLDTVLGIALSSNDRTLISISADRRIQVWDLTCDKQVYNISQKQAQLTDISISPNNRWFAASGLESQLRIRTLDRGRIVRSLRENSAPYKVCFSPDSKLLATGCFDRTIGLWDLQTGQKIQTCCGHLDRISALKFSQDGSLLFSSSWDKTIKVWQVQTGRELATLTGHRERILTISTVSKNKMLLSGDADCKLKIWQLDIGE